MRWARAIIISGLAIDTGAEALTAALTPADYRADAGEIADLVKANYAYLDDLPGGVLPTSPMLTAERDAVHDRDSLLRYAEDMIATLADHHALTGSSFKDDWAIVPTYADMWIVQRGNAYVVDAVKPGTPAARALTFAARGGATRMVSLASLYGEHADRPPISVVPGKSGPVTVVFNNALGDNAMITAFDAAMARVAPRAAVTIDLTDTPSGGNTSIARAVMGWFVARPSAYQVHNLPSEERDTGIPRQWIEQVLPRAGKYHRGPVTVRVGRWTGSLGEGMAIGFAALGKPVCGTAMAGLKGAVYDFDLTHSRMRVKFPAERLYTVAGQPREKVVPAKCN